MVTTSPADLESVLAQLGVEILRTTDDEVTGRCPMHLQRTGKEDEHPSWSVNRDSGVHNCFSCGYKGTLHGLVMDLRFRNDAFAAARWLRQFQVVLHEVDPEWRAPVVEAREPLSEAVKYAMYIDPPEWALQARSVSLEAAQHYGVRWDPADDSWILPIRYAAGELAGWQRKQQRGRMFRNYPMGVPKGECLFGLEVFPTGEPAVLLESPLDVCRLYDAGYFGGLASYGAKVSERQMRLLLQATSEVVVALDNDAAGLETANTLKWEWGPRMVMRFFAYPPGSPAKDLGDLNDSEILRGLYEAVHSCIAPLGTRPGSDHASTHRPPVSVRPRKRVRRQRDRSL